MKTTKSALGRCMPRHERSLILDMCVLRCGRSDVKSPKIILVAMVVASLATSALALEEQTVPAPAADQPAAKAAATEVAPGAKKSETGTEIRIPGLGKLGTLPKMDFGLELLYGAAEDKPSAEPERLEDQTDGATVRGSIKHRF
jgi:hypothetical protein